MAQKSFKNNPALRFISDPEKKEAETLPADVVPKGFRKDPAYVETKSRRVQLVFQPSVLERVRKKAAESGLSLNEYCHRILDAASRED